MDGEDGDRLYLREWRDQRGYTLEVLAERAGTSKGYLSDLERGARRWNRDILGKIAKGLNLDRSDLFSPPLVDAVEADVEPPTHYARAWREHRGLTVEQLAARMGSDETTINEVESGKVALGGKRLREMAEALETTTGRILAIDPNEVPPEWLDAFGKVAVENRPAALAMLRALEGGKK